MKKAMIAVAAMAASGTAFAGAHGASANDPSWTYVDAAYWTASSFEAISGVEEIDGYGLTGSYEFATKWHVQAQIGNIEADFGSSSDEIDLWTVRIGGHPAITDTTDAVFDIGYIEWDLDGTEIKPSAITYRMGVRSNIADSLELNAFLTYLNGDLDIGSNDDFSNWAPSIGAQYNITENGAINVSYSWNDTESAVLDGSDGVSLGIRYSW